MTILLWMLAACLATGFVGCGGSDAHRGVSAETVSRDSGPSTPTKTPSELIAVAGRFRSPSGNIRCEFAREQVSCWSLNVGRGVTVGADSASFEITITEIATGPVLPYDQSFRRAGLSCAMTRSGVTCRSERGNGFTMSSEGPALFGPDLPVPTTPDSGSPTAAAGGGGGRIQP